MFILVVAMGFTSFGQDISFTTTSPITMTWTITDSTLIIVPKNKKYSQGTIQKYDKINVASENMTQIYTSSAGSSTKYEIITSKKKMIVMQYYKDEFTGVITKMMYYGKIKQ